MHIDDPLHMEWLDNNSSYMIFKSLNRVPLHKVFSEGSVPPLKYKVLGPKGQPQGEIAVALTFSPTVCQLTVIW